MNDLPDDPHDPIYNAHHEAAHAVAYMSFELRFASVSIVPEDAAHHLALIKGVEGRANPAQHGIGGAAGPAAELYLLSLHDEGHDGRSDPQAHLQALIASLYNALEAGYEELREAEDEYSDSLEDAAVFVIRYWRSITALAGALMEHQTLTFNECCDVVLAAQ